MGKKRTGTTPVAAAGTSVPVLLYLGGILFLALLIRMAALAELSGTAYFDFLLWDERIYHEWAKKIADGTFTSRSIYEFAPLYAYVVAFLYRVFSPDVLFVRFLNVALGVMTCGLVYLIGTALANRKVGLLACLVACLYKPFILYSIVPLKEALSTCLFAAVFYLLIVVTNGLSGEKDGSGAGAFRPGGRFIVQTGALGLAVGLLINVRPNAVIIAPVIFILMGGYAFRGGLPARKTGFVLLMFVMGAVLALSPFLIRNYAVAGKLALTTSQGGFNLYLGNNLKNPDPYYRPVPFATTSPFEQGIHFTIEASRRVGKRLSPDEASRYWTRETLREAKADPGAFLWKQCQKTLAMVNRFEACDHYGIDFMGGVVRIFRLPFIGFGLVFPLAMMGMIIGGLEDRKARAAIFVLAAYAATLIAFFPNGRYRVPIMPLLIAFSVLGATGIIRAFREGNQRRVGGCLAVVLLFVVVENLPVRATDDEAAYYNTHAIVMNAKGAQDEAVYYWNLSSEMDKPFSAFANLPLAGRSFQMGRPDLGHAYLNRISDDSFAAAQKNDLLGDVLFRQGNLSSAAAAYEKSLSINSGQRRTLWKLIRLYGATDPAKASEYERRLRYVSSFYDLM
ncbi:MAG TPA: tetratricopeptide repeat protein [Syntrophales bacterium]|nr:tetratricopeptide repeat protein [Syntrophales bacterium]